MGESGRERPCDSGRVRRRLLSPCGRNCACERNFDRGRKGREDGEGMERGQRDRGMERNKRSGEEEERNKEKIIPSTLACTRARENEREGREEAGERRRWRRIGEERERGRDDDELENQVEWERERENFSRSVREREFSFSFYISIFEFSISIN